MLGGLQPRVIPSCASQAMSSRNTERSSSLKMQQAMSTRALRHVLDAVMVEAEGTVISDASFLAAFGIEAAVFNARFARPLDHEALTSMAERFPLLLTLEAWRRREGTAREGHGGH